MHNWKEELSKANNELEAARRHGTVFLYTIGCRCEACRNAKRVANARFRDRERKGLAKPRVVSGQIFASGTHGNGLYRKGCRCDTCRTAHRIVWKRWQQQYQRKYFHGSRSGSTTAGIRADWVRPKENRVGALQADQARTTTRRPPVFTLIL